MKLLQVALEVLNIPYGPDTIERFRIYQNLVLSWNEKVNLTAITDPIEFEKKHFVDSLLAAAHPGFLAGQSVMDVGTGAGFPGIPLAICFPQKKFTLLDSLNKRIKILDEIVEQLGISNVRTIHGRAEDFAMQQDHRERYDICLSRAVARLSTLTEYCLPFVRIGGEFGAYKTMAADDEIVSGKRAISVLGGSSLQPEQTPIPGITMDHQILWVNKVKRTPEKYPRKAGIPSKEPIE